MDKEYIVNRAICTCKFGTMAGILKVTDNQNICINAKLTATDKTLGNVFEASGFCQCKKSSPPRPCTPNVVRWTGAYEGVTINGSSFPLLGGSKGTCVLGCPDCISFETTGQIAVPSMLQIHGATRCLQTDINPLGKGIME
ncbi:PAAR-like protein [Bacteroides heparinolyticus]|uniref:PAAR-like protein n=1 Tax=Prevotella heparinolytica TaxID=28113 RepID=UPI0035A1019A